MVSLLKAGSWELGAQSAVAGSKFGMRTSFGDGGFRAPRSALRVFRLASRRAQASIETAMAFIGVLILLLGSLKIFLWLNERLIVRQQNYEATRVKAGSVTLNSGSDVWDEVRWKEPPKKLDIFDENH